MKLLVHATALIVTLAFTLKVIAQPTATESRSGIQIFDFTSEFESENSPKIRGVTTYQARHYAITTQTRVVGSRGYQFVRLYDLSSVVEWQNDDGARPAPLPIEFSNEEKSIRSVQHPFSPDGSRFITAAEHESVSVWQFDNPRSPSTIEFPGQSLQFYAITNDGTAAGRQNEVGTASKPAIANERSTTFLDYNSERYRGGHVRDIEQDGRFAVGAVNLHDSVDLEASFWKADSGRSPLPVFANQGEVLARTMSDRGLLIGGDAETFLDDEEVTVQPVFWRDSNDTITDGQSGVDYEQVRLFAGDGVTPLFGAVLGVVDRGYIAGHVLGTDEPTNAFIYHVDWETPRIIDEWLLNDFETELPCTMQLGTRQPGALDLDDDGERLWIGGGNCVIGIPFSTLEDEGADVPSETEETTDCNGDGDTSQGDLLCATENTISDILSAGHLVPGDLNSDGNVTFGDFLVLSTNFGNDDLGGVYSNGDIDLDGTIGFADFLIVSENFGASASALASVPEPSAKLHAIVASLLVCSFCRRHSYYRFRVSQGEYCDKRFGASPASRLC